MQVWGNWTPLGVFFFFFTRCVLFQISVDRQERCKGGEEIFKEVIINYGLCDLNESERK